MRPERPVWLADLLALWQAHGTGLVAKHALLHFQDGALTAPSPASGMHSPCNSQPLGWAWLYRLGHDSLVVFARGCLVLSTLPEG